MKQTIYSISLIRLYFIWLLAFSLISLAHSAILSQNAEVASIEVWVDQDVPLTNAFGGGLRAPQFNLIDLNQDGVEDLLIFDGAGNVLLPMLADSEVNPSFRFAPEWASPFPPITEWMILEDYDKDGVKDIFCFPTQAALPGIEVWKGKIENGKYAFELLEFPDEDFNILFIPVRNGRTQIYVSVVDLPVIEDIDKDGDLDILSFEPGGSSIFYYENRAVEDFDDLSVLSFVLEDDCYGRFVESGLSESVLISSDGIGCGSSVLGTPIPTTRHAGSSIEVVDVDGDDRFDILLGDIAYNGLNLLSNGGTNDMSWITSSMLRFPSQEPIFIELFLAPKSIDINNDQSEDLLVSSNDIIASQSVDNVWYYRNEVNQGFQGELVTKNFLSETMIDLGEYSSPSFTDYNQDGLIDLVIGTSGKFINTSEKEPTLYLFKNIGTASVPKFQLIDSDYLGFNEFKTTSSFFAPSFGDLDGDGDNDLIVGDNRGFLYYSENVAGEGNEYQFGPATYQFNDIRVSGFARPTLFDLNGDGLSDMIIGERNFNSTDEVPIASLNYFQNIGSIGQARFDENVNASSNNAALGAINLKEPGFINNNSSVALWIMEDDVGLITGSEAGTLHLFSGIVADLNGVYTETFDNQLNSIDAGIRSTPAVADIDGDGLIELAVGNYRGGIALYETQLKSDLSTSVNEESLEGITLYPNPVSDFLYLDFGKLERSNLAPIQIFDYSGKTLMTTLSYAIDMSAFSSGIYLVAIPLKQGIAMKRVIKL